MAISKKRLNNFFVASIYIVTKKFCSPQVSSLELRLSLQKHLGHWKIRILFAQCEYCRRGQNSAKNKRG